MNGQAPEGGGPASAADTAPPTASTIPISAKPTSRSGMARAREFEAALTNRDPLYHRCAGHRHASRPGSTLLQTQVRADWTTAETRAANAVASHVAFEEHRRNLSCRRTAELTRYR